MRKLALVATVALTACSSPAKPPSAAPPAAPPAPEPVAAAPRAADPAPPAFRLPGDVVPKAARLDFTIVPAKPDARGHVAIDAEVRRATRVVWLNATEMTLTAATLAGAPARVIPGGDDFVGLTVDRQLPPGPLAIEADFAMKIDHDKSRGLYTQNEGADAYSYTFFEPVDARRAFPCFDEPAYKIPWTLSFHVQRDHVALGNAPVASETEEAGGMKRVVLAQSKPMPSYLVAFVVGPFEVVDGGTAGRAKTPIRFVIPKGRAGELGFAKEITPHIVAALEDYFDMPYPYVKLDVAVVPRYWGTMEHPGLLAMGQPLTLIRPDQATRDRKQGYANIAAHELSHYWFGDYVTMAWWNDTWLNEALGEWLDAVITNAIEPTWRFELERVNRVTWAMGADETLSTLAIRQPVTSAKDIEAAFDGDLTYLKGSSVMRMFEAFVGADAWRDFMRGYVRAHAWGNATADDLFTAVGAKLGPKVEAGLRSFVEQPGVPLIGMKLACAGGAASLALHQTRSLPVGVADPAPHTWSVPVCVRYGTDRGPGARACTMLDTADGALALPGPCPTWIVPNADAGYYRSALAGADQLLVPGSRSARAGKPTVAEKIMLAADVRAAIDRDELPISKALALAPGIVNDPDPKIAAIALSLSAFNLFELPADLVPRGMRYLLGIYRPLMTRLGWKRRPGDSDEVQQLRQSATWFARYDATLSAQAAALAKRWFDDRTAIDDDMFEPVFATAAFHGDAALFDRVLARAKTPRDRIEQQRLESVLGLFTDPALVDRALALTLGTELDIRDTMTIVYAVLSTHETRALALAFLEAHLDELLPRMREDDIRELLGAVAQTGCNRAMRDRVAAIVKPRAPKYSGSQMVVDRSLARMDTCIASFARQLPALTAFLAKR